MPLVPPVRCSSAAPTEPAELLTFIPVPLGTSVLFLCYPNCLSAARLLPAHSWCAERDVEHVADKGSRAMMATMLRCVVGIVLMATTMVAAPPDSAAAVDLGASVEVGASNGLRFGVAYNPERDDYLAALATQTSLNIVRLDADGTVLSGPTPVATDLGFVRFDAAVSYNAATDQ